MHGGTRARCSLVVSITNLRMVDNGNGMCHSDIHLWYAIYVYKYVYEESKLCVIMTSLCM